MSGNILVDCKYKLRKKKDQFLLQFGYLSIIFFLSQSNCGQDCCLLKCWITSHWKTKYAMGNNLILGKGRISVQQILKTFFRRFIKYSSRSCRRNQFTSLWQLLMPIHFEGCNKKRSAQLSFFIDSAS